MAGRRSSTGTSSDISCAWLSKSVRSRHLVSAEDHDSFRFLFGSGSRRDEEFNDAVRRITAEAATAVAPLIAVDISEEHRKTLAHALVGLAEGASRRLVELGDDFDPDEIAADVSALAWAGLRAIQPKD